MTSSQARKSKVKWTERMNNDILECKKKAKELASSENPPCNENGRKRGYVDIMKELWDGMGYAQLGLKSQNLRDQAARLKKMSNNETVGTVERYATMDAVLSTTRSDCTTQDVEGGYGNSTVTDLDLHMVGNEQGVEERKDTIESSSHVLNDVPGCLPEYMEISRPHTVIWDRNSDGEIITISSSLIDSEYNEITTWRKNTFLVPYGKIGRDFIDQLSKHINDWNSGTAMQHLALKAAIVLLAVRLQKPHQKSKAKEHQVCLEKRLKLWRNGKIDCLLREGRMIQRRIQKSCRNDPPNKAKIFAKLVMEGQINSALRYLSENDGGGVLPLTDDVLQQLREKHPEAHEAKLGSLLFGPVEDFPDSIYQQINGEMIREATLRTKGSGGPSGMDAVGFKRILACKSFKRSSTNLCDSLAKRLCTQYMDPLTIEPILANRLIPLDKGNGEVRPIGVGEVIRRIIGKCVSRVGKQDVIDACGATQVCAGHKSGSEAAIHAMHNIFESDETDAALLIDASNAFNSLNRAATLHNVRVLCPMIATYAINTYRAPARLFVIGGKELLYSEDTTQGDPLAMSLYAISLQPLITLLGIRSSAKQCWYADDATGAGALTDIRKWWDELLVAGPALGYYPNAKKCWLVVKSEKLKEANDVFAGTGINITTEGRKHLGAVLGQRSYLEEYVGSKVKE